MLEYTCNEEDCTLSTYRNGLCKEHFYVERKSNLIQRQEYFKEQHGSLYKIRKGARTVEEVLRCELYHQLKLLKIEMIPEYRDKFNTRYDGLIVKGDIPVAVVEVKRNGTKVYPSQQSKLDRNPFKVPVIYLLGWGKLEETLAKIKAVHGKYAQY